MADAVTATVQAEETGPQAPVVAEAPAVPDKFKNADGSVNTEALLASYVELEKKQGATKEEAKPAEGEKPKEGEQPKAEEKKPDTAQPKSEIQQNVENVLKASGLELSEFNNEYAEKGELSEDSYKKLEAKGYSKATVDQFIRGVVSDANTQIADMQSVAGGPEAYGQMVEWAKSGLSATEVAEFNEAVSSGKPGIIKAAVQMLKGKFDASEGREPALINSGNSRPAGDVFQSWNEIEAAMSDKRYGKDPAYTKSVEQKALRSDVRKR